MVISQTVLDLQSDLENYKAHVLVYQENLAKEVRSEFKRPDLNLASCLKIARACRDIECALNSEQIVYRTR